MVLVDHAVEDLSSPRRGGERDERGRVMGGRVLVEALVRAVRVEMVLVFGEDGPGVSFVGRLLAFESPLAHLR